MSKWYILLLRQYVLKQFWISLFILFLQSSLNIFELNNNHNYYIIFNVEKRQNIKEPEPHT